MPAIAAPAPSMIDGREVCACLTAIGQCEGSSVTTVEGLAADGRLTALQASFLAHGAAQCGICTPGMLMAARGLLAREANPSKARSRMRSAACCAAAPATRRSSRRSSTRIAFRQRAALPEMRGPAVGASMAKVDGAAQAHRRRALRRRRRARRRIARARAALATCAGDVYDRAICPTWRRDIPASPC